MRCELGRVALAAVLFAGLAASAQAPEGEMPLREARAAYQARATAGQSKVAVDLFEKAAKAALQSYEARWEGARAAYYYGNFDLRPDAEKEWIAGVALSFLSTENGWRITERSPYPTSRFISLTAASRPANTARAKMAWPMFNSSISGMAQTGPTFR